MNIAVVTWLVNDVGGINSWTENFIAGAKALGHTVQLYYSTPQQRLNCHPTKKVFRSPRYHLLPAQHLSYRRQELKKSVAKLNEFDRILFAHPCPHVTRANVRDVVDEKAWQALYCDTKPPKAAIFHDETWERTKPWMADVRQHLGYVVAAQHRFYPAVGTFCGNKIPYDWSYFPLIVPKQLAGNENRVRRFILATQWLPWKNHRHLVPKLLGLNRQLWSYGTGQMFYKLHDEVERNYRAYEHCGQVHVCNTKSKHYHYGYVEYQFVLRAMEEACFSLDLSNRGYTNMTHWEPMTRGAISLIERDVINDPNCEIPDDCCLGFNLGNVVDELNAISQLPIGKLLRVQDKAWKFVQCCERSKVAGGIIKAWTQQTAKRTKSASV